MKRFHGLLAFLFLTLPATPLFSSMVNRQNVPPATAPNPDLDNLVKRAESQVARKLYDDAIETYKRCLEMSPRDASLYNRLGVALHRRQNYKEAKKNYEHAVKLNPQYAEAYNNLGTIAYSDKKFGRAAKEYRKALKLRPDASTMHYNLGSAYFAMDKYDKAFEEYQVAFTSDPDLMERISATGNIVRTAAINRAKYHFYIAKIYAALGESDRAIDYLTRAFEEGFKETELIYKDQAFAGLIKDEKFKLLMQNPPKPIE